MALFFGKSVVSPVLIGRAEYLAAFEQLAQQMSSGAQPTVFLSGEAGIGKSRLVAELQARVGPEQAHFLQGSCSEHERALPLAPLIDLLRGLLLGNDQAIYLTQLAPVAPELVKIMPDLSFWLPQAIPTPTLEPEREKGRLFAALTSFLLRVSEQHPFVLVLEDLHWSDEISLEFLHFLLRHRGTSPLFVLLTYRHTEVQPPLQRLRAALNRERAAVEFALTALSKEEVHELVRAVFGLQRPLQRRFLNMLYTLTEGNPFFVEEVLKTLLANGDIFFQNGIWDRKPLDTLRIPHSIADAVQQRLSVLSEEARELVALAAVVGRQLEFSLLQTLTQYPPETLSSLLETLIAVQLLVQTADGRVAFRHALTRQAVYEHMLLPKRQMLHLHVAQAIECQFARVPEDYLTDLATHFYQAQAWPQAFQYGQMVGEKALARYIPQAAVEHLTHALEAASYLPEVSVVPLYRARGQAHHDLGNFAAAQSDCEQALEATRETGDQGGEWQSLLKLGVLWIDRDYTRTGDYFQQALTLAQAIADPQKSAHSQNYLAYWLTNIGQPARAIPLHEEALAYFQQRAEMPQVALTLEYFILALAYSGDLLRSISSNDQASALLRAADQKRNLVNCLLIRCGTASLAFSETVWSARVPLARCQQDLEESLDLTRALEWQPGQAGAHLMAGLVYTSYGLLGKGLAHAQTALEIATEIESRQWIAASYYSVGAAHLALLDPTQAIAVLEAGLTAARSRGAAFWIGMLVAVLAQAYLLAGDLFQAETILAQVFSPEQTPSTVQERCIHWIWGELALAQQKPELALQLAEGLLASIPGEALSYPIPTLWKLRAEALSALGQHDEALRMLEEAEEEARIQGALPLLWQIQRSLGHVSTLVKQRIPARHAFASARETIATLAASLDDEQQRTSFSQAALATLPKEHTPTPRQQATRAFDGLSEREREIVLLMVQGKTKREIAEACKISYHTVSTHIGHIYEKLGLSTRAQLARWTIDKGLT